MEKKILKFQVFRFHLLPLTTKTKQFKIFEEKELTPEEIRENKNKYFKEILDHLDVRIKSNPLKVVHSEDHHYLFKIAQLKRTTLTKNFEDITVDNEPFVYVIIDNSEDVQKIAISHNSEAFTEPKVVKNILKSYFLRELKAYGLNIEIEELFKKSSFWNYVREHKYQLAKIDFKFIKPNLASISKSLSADFKEFSNSVNSHESQIIVQAPKNGVLENIDKNNKEIRGLVDYTSEGAGEIKLKLKGVKKMHSTKENPITFQIDEMMIEGAADQIIKVYKSIIPDDNS